MKIKSVGSICSGIEAASVAWKPLGFHFDWLSEISCFPSQILKDKYPDVINLGDMISIPQALVAGQIPAPELICGGTPCQAFSLAGSKGGLGDRRGNLTLKFVDIVEANDHIRSKNDLEPSIIFWENVEGVLTDKTNAFGSLISSLAGFDKIIQARRWPNAGVLRGPKRNLAWRVLDAKYFGLPQQRKRLYLLAGGPDFYPENILFEPHTSPFPSYPVTPLTFEKEGHYFEVFRSYTDCLYSAYGTKWNGNAAAYNGSLFVVQNDHIRRLSPLECERLMGFPDHYTNIPGAKKTKRYQAIGNSWAVPVINWIGQRILDYQGDVLNLSKYHFICDKRVQTIQEQGLYWNLGQGLVLLDNALTLNCTTAPENCIFTTMQEIVAIDPPKEIYLSPVGCSGILRRSKERKLNINTRLEEVLIYNANK